MTYWRKGQNGIYGRQVKKLPENVKPFALLLGSTEHFKRYAFGNKIYYVGNPKRFSKKKIIFHPPNISVPNVNPKRVKRNLLD